MRTDLLKKKKNNYQHQLIAMLDPVKIKEFLDI